MNPFDKRFDGLTTFQTVPSEVEGLRVHPEQVKLKKGVEG